MHVCVCVCVCVCVRTSVFRTRTHFSPSIVWQCVCVRMCVLHARVLYVCAHVHRRARVCMDVYVMVYVRPVVLLQT